MRLRLLSASLAAVVATAAGVAQTPAPLPAQSPAPATPAASAAISGSVTDALTGRPLAGAIVSLRPPIGSTTGPLIRLTRQLTDDRGRFVFTGLPPGDGYTISTVQPGYVDGAFGQSAMLAPPSRIVLREGQWFPDANIQMWKPGAISGRVFDEFGEPAVGVFVRALAQQFVAGRQQLLAGPVAATDDRGEYRIGSLPPGGYLIQVPSVQSTVPTGASLPRGSQDETIRLLVPQAARTPRTDAVLNPVGPSRLVVGNYAPPPPAEADAARPIR